ncbi:S-protein homolog 5-like, partial [Cucurbita pepo subsp. pepo]|uniref:S-protein homolog 5-like n=1 Tax=Cucurbita pepo subsp. pepo TaxID=3664 RepID=UPI000C9D43DE
MDPSSLTIKTNLANIKVKQNKDKYSHIYKMNSFSTLAFALLMSLFFTTLFTTIDGSIFKDPPMTVNITNVLKSHNQLAVRCKSSDDDLRIHQLPPLGGYAFTFQPNFWGSTQFYCTFEWSGFSHYFDIYKDNRDRTKCNNTLCLWIVGEQ